MHAPVGLCGVVSTIARVRSVSAASTSATSSWKPPLGRSGTCTGVAPEAAKMPG